MSKESSVTKGVADSFEFWLSQHDVSVPELMESAIQKAMKAWLDENADLIVRAIAAQIKPFEQLAPERDGPREQPVE